MNDELNLEKKLDNLREQHRTLDSEIERLLESPYSDQLLLFRLKREKLSLRDQMLAIEEELYPDIIA